MRAWHAAGLLDQDLRVRLGPDGTFGPLRDLGPAPFGVDDVQGNAPENTGNLFSSADDMAFLNSSY